VDGGEVMAMPNAELAYKVLDHIDAHPETWKQGQWIGEAECGTVACFAGWAVLLSGQTSIRDDFAVINGDCVKLHISEAAEILLGIEEVLHLGDDAPDPFDALLTRQELGERVADIFGPRPGGAA
jgi:hypothetical protein